MSRCMAFPPPGYVCKGLSGDALMEFLKARKDMAKAEKQRKKEEKKKMKIERKKRREQKEELEEGEIRQTKHNHHCRKSNEKEEPEEGEIKNIRHNHHEQRNDDEELEEGEIRQTPHSHSRRSTGEFKRKRHNHHEQRKDDEELEEGEIRQIPHSHSRRSNGEVKRKRHSHRHKSYNLSSEGSDHHNEVKEQRKFPESEGSGLTEEREQPAILLDSQYESSDNSHHIRRRKRLRLLHEDKAIMDFNLQETNQCDCSRVKDSISKPIIEKSESATMKVDEPWRKQCPSSLQPEVGMPKLVPESECKKNRLQKLASEYQDLIVNWVPPPLAPVHQEDENLDWLFAKSAKKQSQSNMDAAALTYALPYTIPF